MSLNRPHKLTEAQEQKKVIEYVQVRYPHIYLKADISGVNVGAIKGRILKSLGNTKSHPDITIFEPKNGYNGLLIELKKTGINLKNKLGKWAKPHYEAQAETINILNKRGYYATFAIGFTDAKNIIDKYLAA